MTRQLPQRDYLALKAAFRDLVEAAGGTNRAAEHTRAAPSMISRYGAIHEPSFAPIDVIADLEAETGQPLVSRLLAEMSGFALVRKADGTTSTNFVRHLGRVGHETAEAVSALADAIGDDGEITPREAAAIEAEVTDAERELASLREDLRRVPNVMPLRAAGR